jgi:hypothetical protein
MQSNTARAEEPSEGKFSNKPTVVADNGHGTKVKLWTNKGENGEYQTVSIDRSFKREGSDQWETQKANLNAQDLLTVSRGLEKAHDAITEKQTGKQAGPSALKTVEPECGPSGSGWSHLIP